MNGVVIAVVALAVVAIVLAFVFGARRRGPSDDIDSFRRQIDALSPESRRQTSDRMRPSDEGSTGDDGGDDH